jgi:ketosteroid isomerase-like protein
MRYSTLILLICFGISQSYAQSDEKQILAIRNASNEALRNHDQEVVYSFLTDDVLVTTGNGTLLTGKKAIRSTVSYIGDSKIYWVRTPIDIEVNEETGLAWETGIWKGILKEDDPQKGGNSMMGGNYSAMWTKESGVCLIKSQLFVTLK